jgi:Leucine Rich repeat
MKDTLETVRWTGRSLQYLFDYILFNDFLGNSFGGSHHEVITELELVQFKLSSKPSDGGLNVLTDFFARSDTSLTKVTLGWCDVGSRRDASQLLAAFHSNRTVTDLTIRHVRNLQGAALCACLSGLLQNMPQLHWLECGLGYVDLYGEKRIRAGQRDTGLDVNRTLKVLDLGRCDLRDDGIRIIADALVVGKNTTMDVLCVHYNGISSNGLPHITRILQSTRLKSIRLGGQAIFEDGETATRDLPVFYQDTSF